MQSSSQLSYSAFSMYVVFQSYCYHHAMLFTFICSTIVEIFRRNDLLCGLSNILFN